MVVLHKGQKSINLFEREQWKLLIGTNNDPLDPETLECPLFTISVRTQRFKCSTLKSGLPDFSLHNIPKWE
jgi:hypothetical protein